MPKNQRPGQISIIPKLEFRGFWGHFPYFSPLFWGWLLGGKRSWWNLPRFLTCCFWCRLSASQRTINHWFPLIRPAIKPLGEVRGHPRVDQPWELLYALPCPAAKATHSKVTGWADNKFEKLLQPKPGLATVHGSNTLPTGHGVEWSKVENPGLGFVIGILRNPYIKGFMGFVIGILISNGLWVLIGILISMGSWVLL